MFTYLWCCNPNLGLARLQAKMKSRICISRSHECKRVLGNEHSHSQVNSHFGSWSPNGLLNLQKAIARVKTHWIEKFFILLEIYWNVNVLNGLAWLIWTFETQVVAKRKSGIDPIYSCSGGVRHIFGKLSTRATTLL
jgi:hypothetical protein